MKIKRKSAIWRVLRIVGSRVALFTVVGVLSVQTAFGADPRMLTATQLDSQRSLYNSWNAGPGPGAVKDGYVFETDPESGVLKVINTNEASSTIAIARGGYMHGAYAATLVGQYVYVTASGDGASEPERLYVYDASDLDDVHQVGKILLSSVSSIGLNDCHWNELLQGGLAVPGGLVERVTCGSTVYLTFIDLQNPTAPVFTDSINYDAYFYSLESMQLVGSTVYVYSSQLVGSTYYLGLDVSDLSNVTIDETGNGAFTIYGTTAQYRDGDRLYLAGSDINADPRDDLYVIDASDPSNLSVTTHQTDVFTVEYGYDGRTQMTSDGNLVMWLDEEIATISVASPDTPSVIGKSGSFWSGQYIGLDENDRLYFGDGKYNQTTLQVYDVSNVASGPELLEAKTVDLYRGYNAKVVVPNGSDTALVVTNGGPVIRRVDISDPNNIRKIDDQNIKDGTALIDNFTFSSQSDITVSPDGTRMYIVNARDFGTSYTGGTLLVFDITDTSNIQLMSNTTLPDEPIKTNVVKDNVWYVMTENTFLTYAINPLTGAVNALDSTSYSRPPGSDPASGTRIISVVNNQAILLFGAQQVLSINVTDPAIIGSPATVSLPAMASYTNISYPYVQGNTMFLVSRVSTSNCRMYAINATNAASMSVRSSTSHNAAFCSAADDESIQDAGSNRLFYARPSGQDAAMVTIADHDAISIAGVPGAGYSGLFHAASDGFSNLFGYTLVGTNVYGVSDIGDSNMYSIDISDITQPRPADVLTGQIPFYQAFTMKRFGSHLYVGGNDQDESDSDFSAFSIADPDRPEFVGTTVHDYSSVFGIAQQGDYMYTTRIWGGIGVYDITNPEFPVPLTLVDELTTAYDIKVSGDRLYVADQSNGLMTYDITDPANPIQQSSFTDVSFSGLDSIEVVGTTVYGVSDGGDTVIVIDASDATSPTVETTLTSAQFDQLSKVYVSGDRLYVSGRGDGITSRDSVTVYDISIPGSPQQLGQYVAPLGTGGYGSMELYQDFILVTASGANRIDVIDFEDESTPQLATSITGDTSLQGVNDMEIVGNRLYTISRLGQAINTYSLAVGTTTGPTDPTTPSAPVVSNPAATPSAPNAGHGTVIWWPAYALLVAILLPWTLQKLAPRVRRMS